MLSGTRVTSGFMGVSTNVARGRWKGYNTGSSAATGADHAGRTLTGDHVHRIGERRSFSDADAFDESGGLR